MALDTIVANKKEEVAAREKRRPLTDVKEGLIPSKRSLADALRNCRTGFILECKKASPSRGLIREPFDLNAIASCYAKYADAISVLADERFFQGSLDHVRQVSETVSLPVLCKDVVLDPYQVFEARYFGADAILLMMSVLDDEGYTRCLNAAQSVGLDALTEVHDERELQRALRLGAEIIGINNRNLKTLEVDLNVSRELAPKVPKERVVVIESGISSHAEVRQLSSICHGFLVGSSLMSQPELDRACRELVYGRVKVCGLTRPVDAEMALTAGAVYGGLLFAEESPRAVTPTQAEVVRAAAPLGWVGVFVNESIDEVVSVACTLALDAVQLHGEESPDYLRVLSKQLPNGCEIWKAVRVGGEAPMLDNIPANRIVLDTASKKARGGTGQQFDWSLIKELDLSRVLLGGGLNPKIARAADSMDPYGLDVNSGVETMPGIKSMTLLGHFFIETRGYKKKGLER